MLHSHKKITAPDSASAYDAMNFGATQCLYDFPPMSTAPQR
jgi:hypothetical protein